MSATTAEKLAEALGRYRKGEVAEAAELYAEIIASDPRTHEAYNMMGVIAYQAGEADEAIRFLTKAIALKQDFIDAWANLATVRDAAGHLADAVDAARRATMLAPQHPVLRFNLANLLAKSGQKAAAAAEYQVAVALLPAFADAWNNLGMALLDLGDLAGATHAFEQACTHKPDYREARYNLANTYRDAGRLGDAEREMRAVIAATPTAKAYNSLGNILGDMARPEDAHAAFRKAVATDPTWVAVGSNLMSAMQYLPSITAADLADAHNQWADAFGFARAPAPAFQDWNRDPERKLRIGLVSPDFGVHPVGLLSVRLFEHLDPDRLAPVIFSTRAEPHEDAISRRIAARTAWLRLNGASDETLEAEIRAREVDILFDMSGHTSGHRLAVFARKPAPVQLSWIGYVGTTGVGAIDYVLADPRHARDARAFPGPEQYLRMPHGYICFDPPPDELAARVAPSAIGRPVTFGCLNNPAKLNDKVIASFARILSRVTGSKLILRFRGLNDPAVRERLENQFALHGISSARLDIRGGAPREEFLRTYREIDVALDTFPYSGGLTTCEALSLGVPVLTFPGATFAGRHATSHVTAAGFPELSAPSQAAFEDAAVALGQDPIRISVLRADLLGRVRASPLCDGAKFARDFELAIRGAWRAWCISQPA